MKESPLLLIPLLIYPDPYTLGLLTVALIALYFITQHRIKTNFHRQAVSSGKYTITYMIRFTDKIILSSDQHTPVEYDYSQINQILETKSFYLLRMKYKLHMICAKDNLINNTSTTFVDYLFSKCIDLNSRKVISVSNAKRKFIILTVVLAVLTVLGYIVTPLLYLMM